MTPEQWLYIGSIMACLGMLAWVFVKSEAANARAASALLAELRRAHEASFAEYRRMYGVLAMSKGIHPHHVEPEQFAPSGSGMEAVRAAAGVLDQEEEDAGEYASHQRSRAKEYQAEQLREYMERIERLRAEREEVK